MSKKKTKEEFIKEATEKHNGKYDYSKVEYVGALTKVCIICSEHGEFKQAPNDHLKGCGCPKCAKERCRSSKEEFIEKAKEIHGDKYDYSKVVYVNSKTNVCIICYEHGEFWQLPFVHTKGHGCQKCSGCYVPTKEEWIASARKVHGNKYDYSKTEYINDKTKVCIICPEHRAFWQIPNSHLSGCGCPNCGTENSREKQTSTKEEFIEKAKEIHGNKYDYSKVEYVNCKTKVCIICPEHGHGEFLQTPSAHLRGQGCSKCGSCYVPTKEEWTASARKVHGDKYDYSKVEYVNNKTKVCIICNEHGGFWQTPSDHLQGKGCHKCKGDKTRERCTSTKEEFIKKAREVHGDKYEYTKVEYVNNRTKVCIKCHKHGKFWQVPSSHLNGNGCPECANEVTGERCRLSKEEFIKKARETHGNEYDYSKVEYVNNKTKVCIICPEHGEFRQAPHSHMQGVGCPKCNLSHLERSVMVYLDKVGIQYVYQKRFDWLGLQSLDFYLTDYNVGIECQGEQHFFPVDFRSKGVEWACEMFKKTVSRDKRKKALCEKHGVKLLYFGNVPNYDAFLGEVVHNDIQYLIDYLEEDKK